MKYTRKYLIEMCEKSIVPYEKWRNRDSYFSHVTIGTLLVCLRAGCKFRISHKGTCATDERTIWVEIQYYNGFKHKNVWEMCYLPTQKRLDEVNGEDWY